MKIMNVAISIISIILIGYVSICLWLYKNQEKLLFFPQHLEDEYQFSFEGKFEEVFLNTPDGERIHGIYFYAKSPKGVILAFHGNGEALHYADHEANGFVELGYDVLMSDYRSYGKSTGTLSENNLFNDATLFYNHLIEKGWNANDIIIYGRSIGSGVASYLASTVDHQRVILTTPYFSMQSLAAETYPFIPINLILRYPLRNDLHLAMIETPIHIFHGSNDSVIPFQQAKRLAEHLNARGSFTVIQGGEHNNLGEYDNYWNQIKLILK